MGSASDHTLNEAGAQSGERSYGAIVAAMIAVIFLGFVIHAATLAPQGEAGKAPAANEAAPKAGH